MTPGVLLVPTSLKALGDQLFNDVAINETTTMTSRARFLVVQKIICTMPE
jgi:hypothetical protein